MATTKKVTLANVRHLVEKQGGILEHNGQSDYDALSPIGFKWKEADVRIYALPLGECEGTNERNMLIEQAINMLDGLEAIDDDDRAIS